MSADPARRRLAASLLAAAAVATLQFSAVAAELPRPGPTLHQPVAPALDERENAALIETVAPSPPGPTTRCPEPPKCEPEISSVAWVVLGLTMAGMLLTGSWGLAQAKRAQVISEELSRIRIQRTSSIRGNNRTLGEVGMPPHGLGRAPVPPGGDVRAGSATAEAAVTRGARPATPAPLPRAGALHVTEEANARLAMAQAELEPLLLVVRSVEDWAQGRGFDALIGAAPPSERGFLDQMRRDIVAVAARFHALRQARIAPASEAAIDEELERYWEQVYEALDEVYRLLSRVVSDQGMRALPVDGAVGDAIRGQLARLLDGARDYLASDGRRPVPIEPWQTEYDDRIHHATETRKVPGLPPGRIVSVSRVGIVHDGRLVRRPEVIHSA